MTKLLPKLGGKSKWTDETWSVVLQLLRDGAPAHEIALMEGMPSYSAIYWRIRDQLAFEQAHQAGLRRRPSQRKKSTILPPAPEAADAREWHRQALRDAANTRRREVRVLIRAGEYRVTPRTDATIWNFDQRTEDRIIRAVAQGQSITQAAKLPGMPSRFAIYERRRYDPAFAERLRQANPMRVKRLGVRRHSWSEETWDAVADLLNSGLLASQVAKIDGMPAAGVISARRKDPAFAARVPPVAKTRDRRHHAPKVWNDVLVLLAKGLSPEKIAKLPEMPTGQSIRAKVGRDPAFATVAKQVWPKRRSREEMLAARRAKYHAAKRTAPEVTATPSPAASLKMSPEEIFAAARKAIPRGIPTDVRDDVISAMVMAVLEGKLRPEDIGRRAKEFVSNHYAEFNEYKGTSLDSQPVGSASSFGVITGIF